MHCKTPGRTSPPTARSRPVTVPIGLGWRERGNCRGADPALFDECHPSVLRGMLPQYGLTAVRYCLACPVRAACGAEAAANRESGLWAGVYRASGGAHRTIDLLNRSWIKARVAA